jgi:hypothetical protein
MTGSWLRAASSASRFHRANDPLAASTSDRGGSWSASPSATCSSSSSLHRRLDMPIASFGALGLGLDQGGKRRGAAQLAQASGPAGPDAANRPLQRGADLPVGRWRVADEAAAPLRRALPGRRRWSWPFRDGPGSARWSACRSGGWPRRAAPQTSSAWQRRAARSHPGGDRGQAQRRPDGHQQGGPAADVVRTGTRWRRWPPRPGSPGHLLVEPLHRPGEVGPEGVRVSPTPRAAPCRSV